MSVSSGESTHLSSSVTELGSVVEYCPPHQHLCREGEGRGGEGEGVKSKELTVYGSSNLS